MSKKLDWSKPIQTRDGREVEVLRTGVPLTSNYSVVCLVKEGDKYDAITCGEDGKYFGKGSDSESLFDIVNSPEKKEGWVNLYKHGKIGEQYKTGVDVYSSEEIARVNAHGCYPHVGVVKITWEE